MTRNVLVGTEQNRLQHLLDVKNGQLQALLEVTTAISENMPPESLYNLYEAIAEGHLSVQAMAFYIYDKTRWEQVVHINARGLCSEVDVSELLERYPETGELTEGDKKRFPGIKYAIPVHHDNKPLALALMGELNEAEGIPEEESLLFARTITSIVAVAVENQRLWQIEKRQLTLDKELEVASRIQNLLVPGKLPENKLYEFAGFYLPHKSIGGDYYDVFNISHNELVFCIADISGKGVAAALVMANLQAYLNAIEKFNLEDPAFISRLNSKTFSVTDGDKFITLFVARYDILTRTLTYVNAGHNPPILMTDGEQRLLDQGCTVLGAMEEIPKVTYSQLRIPVGAMIVCYTDGLTELENEEGEQYTTARLREFLKDHQQERPSEFVEQLTEQLTEFKGSRAFSDDISLLVCKFL